MRRSMAGVHVIALAFAHLHASHSLTKSSGSFACSPSAWPSSCNATAYVIVDRTGGNCITGGAPSHGRHFDSRMRLTCRTVIPCSSTKRLMCARISGTLVFMTGISVTTIANYLSRPRKDRRLSASVSLP
jgi:hypothetical protein